MDPCEATAIAEVARRLDSFDVAIIAHEFGIFGPDDGVAVLDLLTRLDIDSIVVLHTVLATPTFQQRRIIETIGRLAVAVVVMSGAARATLMRKYRIDPKKLNVIPHGAHANSSSSGGFNAAPRILTWGLIGPGKGIEWGIRALPALRHLKPRPVYCVWGETHPNVRVAQGEQYRHRLLSLANQLGVADMLDMRSEYLDNDALSALVSSSDVVLLPYDSREQATSGVLIEAVAAGKPVVASRFPHAVDLLGGGAGLVVPHESPDAIAAALMTMLTDAGAHAAAANAAKELARSLLWPAVAERYEALACSGRYQALTRQAQAMEVA